MESVLAVASFQVYGMVTVQVTVLPDPRATATAADSEMKFPLPMSSTLASTSHPIFAVAAIVESTVMVNVVTILPEKLVGRRLGIILHGRMRHGVENSSLWIEVSSNPVRSGRALAPERYV